MSDNQRPETCSISSWRAIRYLVFTACLPAAVASSPARKGTSRAAHRSDSCEKIGHGCYVQKTILLAQAAEPHKQCAYICVVAAIFRVMHGALCITLCRPHLPMLSDRTQGPRRGSSQPPLPCWQPCGCVCACQEAGARQSAEARSPSSRRQLAWAETRKRDRKTRRRHLATRESEHCA